ncbi:MAG: C40 family peptidase [Clostridia bacterium]|nr:C40 family peptidase [Clostridia bacterium]
MVVRVPFSPLFASYDLMSEHIDEVIYGDGAEILEECGGFYKIKTDYGYIGWINKENIAKNDLKPNYIVNNSFADLLFEDRNFYKPAMTLPKGARIEVAELGSRYARVKNFDGKHYYIHKEHILPLDSKKDGIRELIVKTALSYLGTQYRWGGRTYNGIDCSGLCFNAYRFNGINIWRDADIDRSDNLKRISLENAKIGDLLFFKGHMALYLGDGRIVHSSASRGYVAIEELNERLKEIYICAGTAF